MKKIIVGYLIDGKTNGIDKYLMNFLAVVKKNNIQVDFLSNYGNEKLIEYLNNIGSKLYVIPSLKHPFLQIKIIRKIIQEEKYNVAYFNVSECINITGVYAAHKENVERIIIHSHNSGIGIENKYKRVARYILHNFCKIFMHRWGNNYLACSKKASEWLYPKKLIDSGKVKIVNNAIRIEEFVYSESTRMRIREQFDLENCFVIGHVGGFIYQKNHKYLIEVFKKIVQNTSSARLVLIGDGPEKENIEEKVAEMGLQEKVLFLGKRDDVNDLMQGMDVFVLPSHFEGLPIVGIEAAVSGLPCVFSENISNEVKITDNCFFCSIQQKPENWAQLILSLKNKTRKKACILNNGYCFDLKEQENQLLEIVGEK